ncbi:meteorin isoform X1 [Orcinus orca]|uniref:meteorin isoform X1 n=1 Tax=Orcinus orca TaxID=9733 RepID=UPI002110E700|nr:meteorin isoform X1 [Orcinus orca]
MNSPPPEVPVGTTPTLAKGLEDSGPTRTASKARLEAGVGGGSRGVPRGGDTEHVRPWSPLPSASWATGWSSHPRERRCNWWKVRAPRRDWLLGPPTASRQLPGSRPGGRPAGAGGGGCAGPGPKPRLLPPRPRASPRAMPPPALLCALCFGLLATAARAGYSEDRCSWRGSGLTQEPGSVGQLALACAEGGIEWLYPAGALRLTLGGSDPGVRPGIACLRPARPFAGAQVFAERAGGVLELLLAEGPGPAGGRCVRWGPRERRALFLQATPHPDISRRVASFRFELREDGRPELPPQAHGLSADDPAVMPSSSWPCAPVTLWSMEPSTGLPMTQSCRSLSSPWPPPVSSARHCRCSGWGALGARRRPPFAPHCTVASTLALAPSSSWAGAASVRPGWAVHPASRNSAVPTRLPMLTTSTPVRWCWTEGPGSRVLGRGG